MRPLIDSRLRDAIPEAWPSRCTIQQITYTKSASNQSVSSGATNVSGMVNIPCRMGPLIIYRPGDDEVRGSEIEEKFTRRHLSLNGYFPNVKNRVMQAVVDGVIFPIRGCEPDSQKQNTRLKLEIVNP